MSISTWRHGDTPYPHGDTCRHSMSISTWRYRDMETHRDMETWTDYMETWRHTYPHGDMKTLHIQRHGDTWRYGDTPCPYPHGDTETHGDMETLHVHIHMETLRHMETWKDIETWKH